MNGNRLSAGLLLLLTATKCVLSPTTASAQFVITEMMVNPNGGDDAWEWIEVRNTGPAIDMNGFIGAKLGEAAYISGVPRGPAIINDANHDLTTMVPAGGVAVLYNAQPTQYDESLFRQAWSLSPTVPLLAVSSAWPDLTQSGSNQNFGYWANEANFLLDTMTEPAPNGAIIKYDNAAFNLDYSVTSGWPNFNDAGNVGKSMTYDGTGDYHLPANWAVTQTGTTSIQVSGVRDYGNPGIIPAGAAPAGKVTFTEIMYDPRSDEPDWEWVEVFNNTGSTLDFGATNGVFDDRTGATDITLANANLKSGTIPNGTTAILFNATTGGITEADMELRWGATLNYIPVTGASDLWPQLNNTDDQLGLWLSHALYAGDRADGIYQNAAGAVVYDDAGGTPPAGVSGTWPNANDTGSIYLTNLASNSTVGESWAISAQFDDIGSFLGGLATIHDGGDIGTPGSVPGGPNFLASDFNHSGMVDAADLATLTTNFGTGTTNAQGDADLDGDVDGGDVLMLQRQLGSPQPPIAAIPEPATAILGMLGLAALATRRRVA